MVWYTGLRENSANSNVPEKSKNLRKVVCCSALGGLTCGKGFPGTGTGVGGSCLERSKEVVEWFRNSGYALDQSNCRIPEGPVSPEWIE